MSEATAPATAAPPAEAEAEPVEAAPRHFRFDLIAGVLFKPRRAFKDITGQRIAVWVLPLLLLTLTGLINVGMSTYLTQRQLMMAGPPTLPENMQWMSPEQQAQYMQQASLLTNPLLTFGRLLAGMLARVWLGTLIVTGILHLTLTLTGASGEFRRLNLVTWATIPFAVRDALQILAMLFSGQLIVGPGLSGFAPAGTGVGLAIAGACLGLIEIYPFWQMLLLVIGIRQGTGAKVGRALIPVLLTFLVIVFAQVAVAAGGAALAGLLGGGGGGGRF